MIKVADKWKPLHYTNRLSGTPSTVFRWLALAEQHMIAPRGFKENEPLEYEPYQAWLWDNILQQDAHGNKRFREVLVGRPRKNGKSLECSGICLDALVFGGRGTQVYAAAKNERQADIVFAEVLDAVTNSPYLSSIIVHEKSKKRLRNIQTGAYFRTLPADAGSANGIGPSIVICDEIHEWPEINGKKFYAALKSGSADRRESQVISITTAGATKTGLIGELYEQGLRTLEDNDPEEQFGFFWWGAEEGDDITDPEVWMKANPSLRAGLMDWKVFERGCRAKTPFELATFMRMHLNMWVRIGGISFIPMHAWDKIADTTAIIPPGTSVTLGFDGSKHADATAMVICDIETGVMQKVYLAEKPKDDPEWYVSKEDVIEQLEIVTSMWNVKEVWADPTYWEMELPRWSERFGVRIAKVSGEVDYVRYGQNFIKMILEGEISHQGDADMKRHMGNAIAKESGGFKKAVNTEKIDLVVASIFAANAREAWKHYSGVPTISFDVEFADPDEFY